MTYGVATISRLLEIIGLFCRISSLLYSSFAKETYNFEEPTNRSHSIITCDSALASAIALAEYSLIYRALLQKSPIILCYFTFLCVTQARI